MLPLFACDDCTFSSGRRCAFFLKAGEPKVCDCSSSKCVANYFCSANPRTNRCAVSLDRYWGCWTRERPSLSGQLHFLIWHGQWFVFHAGPDDAPRMEIVSKDQRDGGLPI